MKSVVAQTGGRTNGSLIRNTALLGLALSVLSFGLLSAARSLAELLKESEQAETPRAILLSPVAPELNRTTPDISHVRLDTSQGAVLIELRREWSPHGVDRFYNLVRAGYYDSAGRGRLP